MTKLHQIIIPPDECRGTLGDETNACVAIIIGIDPEAVLEHWVAEWERQRRDERSPPVADHGGFAPPSYLPDRALYSRDHMLVVSFHDIAFL